MKRSFLFSIAAAAVISSCEPSKPTNQKSTISPTEHVATGVSGNSRSAGPQNETPRAHFPLTNDTASVDADNLQSLGNQELAQRFRANPRLLSSLVVEEMLGRKSQALLQLLVDHIDAPAVMHAGSPYVQNYPEERALVASKLIHQPASAELLARLCASDAPLKKRVLAARVLVSSGYTLPEAEGKADAVGLNAAELAAFREALQTASDPALWGVLFPQPDELPQVPPLLEDPVSLEASPATNE